MQKRWVVDETGERIFACENEAEAQAKVAELVAEKRVAWMAENGDALRAEKDAAVEAYRMCDSTMGLVLEREEKLKAERDALQAKLDMMSQPAPPPDPAQAPVGDGIEMAPQA